MLRDREVRQPARAALVAIGAPALVALDRALGDPAVPRRLRMHLPRTISRFASQSAADVLSRHLERELDTVVGHKILRGLGRMIAERERIRIDPPLLERSLEAVLGRALVLLDWRVTLAEGTATAPPTAAGPLLIELLREKEETAVERAFRLLGLRHRDEDVHAVYIGLRSADPHAFASGRELIDHLVGGRVRAAILALVAERDIDDRDRLGLAAPFAEPAGGSLGDALAAMRTDPSEAIAGLTADLLVELEGAVAA
jgi:hypothetical protein